MMLRKYKTLVPIAAVSLVFTFGTLAAHAQTTVAPGATSTNSSSTSLYAATSAQNSGTGDVGATGTTAPGTPNTGAGASAPLNIALLGSSALLALVGAFYLSRVRIQKQAR